MKISVVIPMYNASSTIVRALDSIKEQTFKCNYEIIVVNDGSPEYFREIKKQIADFQLEDYIEIIANTNNILPYMKEADIFLHPSDTEGLPRVIMEAMALKTLVIANAVGGVTDYVLDGFTGFIADFNNIDHYVKLIQDVLNHPERKKQIVENAYALIQDCYSPDSQVKEMKRVLYENMKS